jgi:hypothetical protein
LPTAASELSAAPTVASGPRTDEFTILRGAELRSDARFQFLQRYTVPFMPTLVLVFSSSWAMTDTIPSTPVLPLGPLV